jgi:hypothetical protein
MYFYYYPSDISSTPRTGFDIMPGITGSGGAGYVRWVVIKVHSTKSGDLVGNFGHIAWRWFGIYKIGGTGLLFTNLLYHMYCFHISLRANLSMSRSKSLFHHCQKVDVGEERSRSRIGKVLNYFGHIAWRWFGIYKIGGTGLLFTNLVVSYVLFSHGMIRYNAGYYRFWGCWICPMGSNKSTFNEERRSRRGVGLAFTRSEEQDCSLRTLLYHMYCFHISLREPTPRYVPKI